MKPDRYTGPRRLKSRGEKRHARERKDTRPLAIRIEECPACGSENIHRGTVCLSCGLTLP